MSAKYDLLPLISCGSRKHINHVVYNIQKVKFLLVQRHRTRLNPAHVEHLIDEREQMLAGR